MAAVNLNVPPQTVRAAESPRVDLLLIAEMVRPGARVLDIGCGDGELLRLLAAKRAVDGRGDAMVRVDHAWTADLDERRVAAGDPLRQHPRRRRAAEADDDVGSVSGSELLDAQDRVEGGDRAGEVAAARLRVGEDWPAGRLRGSTPAPSRRPPASAGARRRARRPRRGLVPARAR